MSPEWVKTEKDNSVPITMLLSHYWGVDFDQRNDGYRLGFYNYGKVVELIDQLLPHVEPVQMSADHKEEFIPLLTSLFKYKVEKEVPIPKLHFTPEEIIEVSFTHNKDHHNHYVNFRLASPEVAKETFLTLLPVSSRMEGIDSQHYLKRLLIALGMFEPVYINDLKGKIFPTDTEDPAFKLKYVTYDEKTYSDKLKENIDHMLQEASLKQV